MMYKDQYLEFLKLLDNKCPKCKKELSYYKSEENEHEEMYSCKNCWGFLSSTNKYSFTVQIKLKIEWLLFISDFGTIYNSEIKRGKNINDFFELYNKYMVIL